MKTDFSPTRLARIKARGGFTLVEVVLAIGIIAFAFIPLMGLLPLGLDVSRQAIDTTVQSQIVQQLTTEAQQTDFSGLSDFAKSTTTHPYYYDDQGNKSTSTQGVYEAIITAATQTALPGNITTQKLATVAIYVLNMRANRTKIDNDPDITANVDAKKFIVLIPDNGR